MERKEVRHERYKFRIAKHVEPVGIEGEYYIELKLENPGEMKVKNLLITDVIPSSSSITEFISSKAVTHEIVRSFDKSELIIKMSDFNSGSSIIINYYLNQSLIFLGWIAFPKTKKPLFL